MRRIDFDIDQLHPEVRTQFADLTLLLLEAWRKKETEYLLVPFEGYRSSERQAALLKEGTTKAGPFKGPHWYGLAVDFVPDRRSNVADRTQPLRHYPAWYWPAADHPDWRVLGEAAASVGLKRHIKWDKPHVESPLFEAMRAAIRQV